LHDRADPKIDRGRLRDHLVTLAQQLRNVFAEKFNFLKIPVRHEPAKHHWQRPRRRALFKEAVVVDCACSLVDLGDLRERGRKPHGITRRFDTSKVFVDIGEPSPVDRTSLGEVIDSRVGRGSGL